MTLRESGPSRHSTPGRLHATKGAVVLSGGSAGPGRAAVRAFAAAGDDVAVLARREDGLAGAVGARALVYAAEHPRRSLWVRLSTMYTILGNRLAPAVLGRYLTRTGYSRQQSERDNRPPIGENLYHPVDGDHGAHGDFDYRSHSRSPELWPTTHRGSVLAAATAAAVTLTAILRGRR